MVSLLALLEEFRPRFRVHKWNHLVNVNLSTYTTFAQFNVSSSMIPRLSNYNGSKIVVWLNRIGSEILHGLAFLVWLIDMNQGKSLQI